MNNKLIVLNVTNKLKKSISKENIEKMISSNSYTDEAKELLKDFNLDFIKIKNSDKYFILKNLK